MSDGPNRPVGEGRDEARDRWRATLKAKAAASAPERRERFETSSGIEIRDLYTPADTAGLKVAAPFDGLGLRGNASSPILASGARVPVRARLGADGAGIDVAFATVLPMFQVLNASCSLGLADAAIGASVAHATQARFEHLDQTLALAEEWLGPGS